MTNKKLILATCFIIPVIISCGYFIYRGMTPFGPSSLLTVDMGQQYVDLFAYFRDSLLHHPNNLLYSFQKGLGGDMLGTNAYYLISPFNLLFLLVKASHIPAMITVITILKYGCCGISMGSLLIKQTPAKSNWSIPAFATSYALMGWMVAYQLNLLWLDNIIVLPLVFLGLQRLINDHRITTFTIWLTVSVILNYYIAYMVILFCGLYSLTRFQLPRKAYFSQQIRLLKAGLLVGGLSAFITIPTWFSLMENKLTTTENATKFQWDFQPLTIIGKLVNGSFNFEQLPNGAPNLFVAAFITILFISYFLTTNIALNRRVSDGILVIILILSMTSSPLNLIWHGMQQPAWYPYRFSFIASFLMIYLAHQCWVNLITNPKGLKGVLLATLISSISLLLITIFKKQFPYLSEFNLVWAIIFLIMTAAIIYSIIQKPVPLFKLTLLIIVTGEMTFNFTLGLNQLSYLDANDYTRFNNYLSQTTSWLTRHDPSFYRINRDTSRTKDDAFSSHFNGGSTFLSTVEANSKKFYENLGLPTGNAYLEYNQGTIFSDALLGMKYNLIAANPSSVKVPRDRAILRSDLKTGTLVNQSLPYQIIKNNQALPLVFTTNTLKTVTKQSYPADYQNALAYSLGAKQSLFNKQSYHLSDFNNLIPVRNLNNSLFKKTDLLLNGSFQLTFKPALNTSYYLSLPAEIYRKDVIIKQGTATLNPQEELPYPTMINISRSPHQQTIHLKWHIKKTNLIFNHLNLVAINQDRLTQLTNRIQNNNRAKVSQQAPNRLQVKVTTPQSTHLVTTIPYSKGWHISVDQHSVTSKKWAQIFITIPLEKGKHTINIKYFPVGLKSGLIISIVTLLSLINLIFYIKKAPNR